MRDVIRLGVILLLICGVAAAVLAYVNDITEDRIAAQKALEEEHALQSVLASAKDFRDETGKMKSYLTGPDSSIVRGIYVGYSGGKPVGVAVRVAPAGYGGPIESIVGISSDGVVQGVTVISQQETPGLGANVASPDFEGRFKGKVAGSPVKLTKDGGDIQGLTGATISSRAVAKGVEAALRTFQLMLSKGVLAK
ncbi:MAG TPA: RnfABCDGE type electron transport complex subunit G [Firmicutes bacterium]|nr:RnfABCDGE type electron transport complex subunit G [Bacillota bacterium]